MEQFRLIWQYITRHKWQYIGGIITLFILDFANLYIPKTTGGDHGRACGTHH